MTPLDQARAIRAFDRFYSETIGGPSSAHEALELPPGQARALAAVADLGRPEVTVVAEALALDLPYTSRLLGSLEDRGLLTRQIDSRDRRRRTVAPTAAGEQLLSELEHRSNQQALALIEHLDDGQIDDLLTAMDRIRQLLDHSADRLPT